MCSAQLISRETCVRPCVSLRHVANYWLLESVHGAEMTGLRISFFPVACMELSSYFQSIFCTLQNKGLPVTRVFIDAQQSKSQAFHDHNRIIKNTKKQTMWNKHTVTV